MENKNKIIVQLDNKFDGLKRKNYDHDDEISIRVEEKKSVIKTKNNKIVISERFHIPQLDEKYDGLKKAKPSFQKSIAASPFYGTKVKDELLIPDVKGKVNIDVAYDNFRNEEEKHISEAELIKKYGTKYYDFQMVNEKKGRDDLEEETVVPVMKEEIKQEEEFDFNSLTDHIHLDIDLEDEKEEVKEDEIIRIRDEIKPASIYDEDKKEVSFASEEPKIVKEESKEIALVKIEDKYLNYKLPPLSIFKRTNIFETDIPDWLIEKKDTINQILADFDIDGEVVNYIKGPAFTRYEIMLNSGVKVNKVSSLLENFQMGLGATSIRILAPIPGKKTVGIEVPNNKADVVCFGDIVSDNFVNDNHPIRVALGKSIEGNIICKGIEDMPHCLVAGATKSGKSVCMNTMLISLLIKNKPSDLKLILVDPKKVELTFYEELPHLVTPVISDPEIASVALKWAVDEMENRYERLAKIRVRNIEDYNKKAKDNPSLNKMPYIVIVIDELADLMMTCSSDVEDSIKRITAKARAAGIHLIVATQRPTVQVVSGNIKANIPTRIAFRVASQIDSQTILDEVGAESLLGRGDMLIKDNDAPLRVQGAYISDDEINGICDFIREEADTDYYFTHEELKKLYDQTPQGSASGNGSQVEESDQVLYDVSKFCIESGSCSINSIQTNFNFGYRRAARVVDSLHEMNIVGPQTGSSKGRAILVTLEELDKIFEKNE